MCVEHPCGRLSDTATDRIWKSHIATIPMPITDGNKKKLNARTHHQNEFSSHRYVRIVCLYILNISHADDVLWLLSLIASWFMLDL